MPVAALLLTVRVSTEDPEPGAAMLVGLNPAVTPAGMPLALNATALLKPPATVEVMVEAPLEPCCTVTVFGLADRVKLGEVLDVTVKVTVVV